MTTKGFTLLEMLVVIAIIAILATLATPDLRPARVRGQVNEALERTQDIKKAIATVYALSGKFPADNADAGILPADQLVSLYITSITVDDGVINILFGNKISLPEDAGHVLSIRPVVVTANPLAPMDWLCGFAEVPEMLTAVGENATDMDKRYLPVECRI